MVASVRVHLYHYLICIVVGDKGMVMGMSEGSVKGRNNYCNEGKGEGGGKASL